MRDRSTGSRAPGRTPTDHAGGRLRRLSGLAGGASLVLAATALLLATVAGAGPRRPGLLPPRNPRYALAIDQYLWTACPTATDYSPACLESSLAMLNAGRRSEGLGPVLLPDNWAALAVPEQLFVLTDLERTARGLPPDAGLAASWNAAAQAGADAGRDPGGGGGGAGARDVQSVWAGGAPNAIVVISDWVYADGVFADGASENLGCSPQHRSGCWSHRDIILHDSARTACPAGCVLGAGYSQDGYGPGGPGGASYAHQSFAEVFALAGHSSGVPLVFSWAAEQLQLPACERGGDRCSWDGIPVATFSGIHKPGGWSPTAEPWFPVSLHTRAARSGRVAVVIRTGVRLVGVGVVARSGSRLRVLRVRRQALYRFSASGRLAPGRWRLLIRYRMSWRRGYRPLSTLTLVVPSAG